MVAVKHQTIDFTFFYGNGNFNVLLWTGFFVHQGIISSLMRVDFINNSIMYI